MSRNKKYVHAHRRLFIGIICFLLVAVGTGSIILALHSTTAPNKGSARGTPTLTHGAATNVPTATASVDPSTETALTPSPTPFFVDDFLDNNQSWYVGESAGYTRVLTSEGLQLKDTHHNPMIESLPTKQKFDDFALTITLILQQGDTNDSAGIYLRGDSNLDHDYRLDIFSDSKYAISEEYLDANKKPQTLALIAPTYISHLRPLGHANTLKIIMKGSTMVLLVNGHIADRVVDSNYTQGQIALFVDNGPTSHGTTALFSSIEIAAAPDQVP